MITSETALPAIQSLDNAQVLIRQALHDFIDTSVRSKGEYVIQIREVGTSEGTYKDVPIRVVYLTPIVDGPTK